MVDKEVFYEHQTVGTMTGIVYSGLNEKCL